MEKLTNFKEYLFTKLLEKMNLKVRELELVLSPRLIKTLKEMNHQIADDLLEKHFKSDKEEFKATFTDLSTQPGKVSYILANKVPDLIDHDIAHGGYTREKPKELKGGNKEFQGGYYDYVKMYKNPWISDVFHLPSLHSDDFKSKTHPVWSKYRVEQTALRWVKTLFPKKYKDNVTREELSKQDKPSDLQSFQNMFKAIVEANAKVIKVVEGSDIAHYYSSDNYFKTSGTLGGSCMNSPNKSHYLEMYVKNPNVVKMLILYPEDVRDKIIGRALVWKLDQPDGRYFMDRAYTANDSDEYMFIEYAKSKGYLYKSSQTYGAGYDMIDGKTDKRSWIDLEVRLENVDFDYFPYLDTLQYYNEDGGLLTNQNEQDWDFGDWYQLTDAGGGRNRF